MFLFFRTFGLAVAALAVLGCATVQPANLAKQDSTPSASINTDGDKSLLRQAIGSFKTGRDLQRIVVYEVGDTFIVEMYGIDGRRMDTENELRVVDGKRVELHVKHMVLARFVVTGDAKLTFYPNYYGGAFRGNISTAAGPLSTFLYYRE